MFRDQTCIYGNDILLGHEYNRPFEHPHEFGENEAAALWHSPEILLAIGNPDIVGIVILYSLLILTTKRTTCY
jgi:hypothetical protein